MNKKQSIKLKVDLLKKGYNLKTIDVLMKMKELEDLKVEPDIVEGDKIKLNYEQIISHPNYIKDNDCKEKQVVDYHNFVEQNKDNILTVKCVKGHINTNFFVCFEEDEKDDDYKFIFWTGDLIKIGEKTDENL